MDDDIKFISCGKDDALSSGSAMFKINKLKGKLIQLFQKRKLGEELTNFFRSENLNLSIPIETRRGGVTMYEKWFDEGIPCEILKLRSEGWEKGKIRINVDVSIEFIPDEPEIKESASPLDDLRRQINDISS